MRSVADEPFFLAEAKGNPVTRIAAESVEAASGETDPVEPLPDGPPVSGEQLEVTPNGGLQVTPTRERRSYDFLRVTPAEDIAPDEVRTFTGNELEVTPPRSRRRK